MQVLAQLSPFDWTALQNLSAVVGLLATLAALGGFLLRKLLRQDEKQSRITAEQIAVMVAGKMVASSPEEGDRLSLKERNSIKALIGEAVLSLREQNTWAGRKAIEKLKAADASAAIEIFAGIAEAKRAEAASATRDAAAALRHQGALTLPQDTHGALALFQQAFELDPDDAENLLALAVVQFRLGDIPNVEALIAQAHAGAETGRKDIVGLVDMFAGVLNLRGGRLQAAIEKFDNAKRIFEELDEPRALVDALMALASAQMKAGNFDGALANYGQAQVLCTKHDYQLGLAQLHADLGLLLQGLGRFPDAEQMLLKSFTIAEKQGEIAIAAVAAANLALLYRETHDLDRAEQTIRQALQLETRLKHKDGVARGNLNLGTILFEKGRFAEAASHFQKSLDLYTELDLQGLAAHALYNLGNAQRALKDNGGAEQLLPQGARPVLERGRCLRRVALRRQSGRRLSRCRALRRCRAGVPARLGCRTRGGRAASDRHADAESRRARPSPRPSRRGLRAAERVARHLPRHECRDRGRGGQGVAGAVWLRSVVSRRGERGKAKSLTLGAGNASRIRLDVRSA